MPGLGLVLQSVSGWDGFHLHLRVIKVLRGNAACKDWDRYLLVGETCPVQTRHNSLEYGQDRNPGYFLLAMRPAAMKILGCHGLHWYVDYPVKEKKLGKFWKMEEVSTLAFSAFAGNRYVQHGGVGWKREHALRYTTYVVSDGAI